MIDMERQRFEKWEAIKRGEPFTEGLSNWAMDKAVMEIGDLKGFNDDV